MKKIYSAVILLSLAVPALAAAEEENKATVAHGTVEVGVQGVGITGDKARFQEFRDMSEGPLGNAQLDWVDGAYHFQFDADKIGLDDQSYQLKGGQYENFKYKLHYNSFIHNYQFDAISPASGIGTQRVTFPDAEPGDIPLSDWTRFDYSVKHRKFGGEMEFSFQSPYYINVGLERREQDGGRPYSVRQIGEVPEPVSTSTNNLQLKGGYLGEVITASITGSLSSFDNDKQFMIWDDPDNANADATAFASDNDYRRIAADFSWRDLPLASVLAAGASYAQSTSAVSANDIGWPTAPNVNTTIIPNATLAALNRLDFDGQIDYTTVSLSLASQPLDKLSSKIYYRYLERENKSSELHYDIGDIEDNATNSRYQSSFEKDDAGIDLDYRLPLKTKLEGGYEYVKTDRSTIGGVDVPVDPTEFATLIGAGIPTNSTKDDVVYVGLKNSALEWLTAKVRYKHMKRDSDEINGMYRQTTPFYYQDQDSDEWKVGLDFYPIDTLDLGVSFTHKTIDYDDSLDTRDKDTRKNLYFDATWRASAMASITGFVGYEKVDTDANRQPTSAGTNSATATTTPFVITNDDDFWAYGLATNIAATDKLTINLAWQYQKSDGQVDFSNPNFVSNTASDDYSKQILEAKASYAIDPRLKMIVGYLYERLEYQDVNYEGYLNDIGTTAPYYYSGLYADPTYEANVGYMMVSYGF